MSTQQQTKLEGKVAEILSERELAINIGSSNGVKCGHIFAVMSAPVKIINPEDQQLLGEINREKIRVKVYELYDSFSICKTYRTYTERQPAFQIPEFLRTKKVPEKIPYDQGINKSEFKDDSYVKVGDRVVLVDEEQNAE